MSINISIFIIPLFVIIIMPKNFYNTPFNQRFLTFKTKAAAILVRSHTKNNVGTTYHVFYLFVFFHQTYMSDRVSDQNV